MKKKYERPLFERYIILLDDSIVQSSVRIQPGGTIGNDFYYIPLEEEGKVDDSWVFDA